jgi:hypothetical protein
MTESNHKQSFDNELPLINQTTLFEQLNNYGIPIASPMSYFDMFRVFVHVLPYIKLFVTMLNFGSDSHHIFAFEEFLSSHLITRVTNAYNLGYVSDAPMRRQPHRITPLFSKFIGKTIIQIVRSISPQFIQHYSDNQEPSPQNASYLFLQSKNLIFNRSPSAADYIDIELDYVKSVTSSLSMENKLTNLERHILSNGFTLSELDFKVFSHYLILHDSDKTSTESHLLDSLNNYTTRTRFLIDEDHIPKFKVNHSDKCHQHPCPILPTTVSRSDGIYLILCDTRTVSYDLPFTPAKTDFSLEKTIFTPSTITNDSQKLAKILLPLRLLKRNPVNTTDYLLHGLSTRVILGDNCSIEIEGLDLNPPSFFEPKLTQRSIAEPWYELLTAVTETATSLAYSQNYHTSLKLSKFEKRLKSYLTIFNQSKDEMVTQSNQVEQPVIDIEATKRTTEFSQIRST